MGQFMNHYSLEPANFPDYRDFLKHRFESLKTQNKNFSLQACAKKSKISKSLLQFLFRKKRHVSLDKLPSLAKSLKLTIDEENFVYLMVCKDANQNPVIRQHFEKILGRIRNEHVRTNEPAPEADPSATKELFNDHLLMILQTLVCLEGFQEDHTWIQENLKVPGLTIEKIQSAMQELEKSGYIYRDENSKLQAKKQIFWRPDPHDPKGFKVYTRAAESVAALMQDPHAYRPSVYSAMSLSMDEKGLLEAEKAVIELHHRLNAIAKESEKKTAVIHAGNFMMTLARLK